MPQLVRTQDQQDGDGVGQPAPQFKDQIVDVGLRRRRAAIGQLVNRHLGANQQHAEDRDDKEQRVRPPGTRPGVNSPDDHVNDVLAVDLAESGS